MSIPSITDLILMIPLALVQGFTDLTAWASGQASFSQVPDTILFLLRQAVGVLKMFDGMCPAVTPCSAQLMQFIINVLTMLTWGLVVFIIYKIISIFRGVDVVPHN